MVLHRPQEKLRIGELLIERGVLTAEQVEKILSEQRETSRPFGDIAEKRFGVSPDVIENAWLEQYMEYGTRINLDEYEAQSPATQQLSRRQAWQFHILPLEMEEGHLIAATSRDHLRRAVNFASRGIGMPVMFLIADADKLDRRLRQHYPWPSMMQAAGS